MIDCVCGRQMIVPKLSELRRDAGLSPYRRTTAEQLQILHARGELPSENTCSKCGRPTESILSCVMECERPVARKDNNSDTIMAVIGMLLLGVIAPIRAFRIFGREAEHVHHDGHGHQVVVETPLRLCEFCLNSLERRREPVIQFMRTIPLYQQLMTEYPQAAVLINFPPK